MIDSDFHPVSLQAAIALTRELRHSSKSRWKSVRERLGEQGIDPKDAAIGGVFPEDAGLETGILATRDSRFYVLTFELGVDEEGNALPSDDGFVDAWKQVDAAVSGAFANMQRLALHVMDRDYPERASPQEQ